MFKSQAANEKSYCCPFKVARRSHRVCTDQINTLSRNTPRLIFGAIVTEILLVVALYGSVSNTRLGLWVALLTIGQVFTFWMVRRVKTHPPTPDDIERWYWLLRLRSLSGGIGWGAGAFLLWVPDNPVLQGLLGGSLFGVVAGAVTTFPVIPSVFYIFVSAAFLPLIVRIAMVGDIMYLCLAGFGLIMFSLMVLSGRSFSRLTAQALAMRYENVDLIEELTEEKGEAERAKEEAERAREQAEQANRAKSGFLAAASHDLRQPMHAMGLYVGALRRRITDKDQAQIVAKLQASVDAMDELFNAMLDVSKLDAGVITPVVGELVLQDLFDRMELQYAAQAREKGLRFRTRRTDFVVNTDATLLDRVVRNFISNAIRYTPQGGILLGARKRGERVRIEVWDTGLGIPQAKQNEVFQEFVQLGNPERDRTKGLGLGLAIVRRLSKLLNHPVGLHSKPGKGSCFYIDVPMGEPIAASVTSAPAALPDAQLLQGAFVAVIDDEAAVLDSTELLLREHGCYVVSASSGQEALDKLARHDRSPDVVVSDYRLRAGQSGIDAVRQIQAEHGEIPAILVTGDTGEDRLCEATHCGLTLLHKPLNPDKLLVAIGDSVRRTQAMYEQTFASPELRAAS